MYQSQHQKNIVSPNSFSVQTIFTRKRKREKERIMVTKNVEIKCLFAVIVELFASECFKQRLLEFTKIFGNNFLNLLTVQILAFFLRGGR